MLSSPELLGQLSCDDGQPLVATLWIGVSETESPAPEHDFLHHWQASVLDFTPRKSKIRRSEKKETMKGRKINK